MSTAPRVVAPNGDQTTPSTVSTADTEGKAIYTFYTLIIRNENICHGYLLCSTPFCHPTYKSFPIPRDHQTEPTSLPPYGIIINVLILAVKKKKKKVLKMAYTVTISPLALLSRDM